MGPLLQTVMTNPPGALNRRRSERVVLQMAITVIAETRERVERHEQAQTLVVNAHGGLMRIQMELLDGQPLTLVHEKSGKREKAHVVRVEQPGEYYAVAFEFDQPAPKFWPVVFPPEDWGATPA
jgi:broad specificity phosphatase PhoE